MQPKDKNKTSNKSSEAVLIENELALVKIGSKYQKHQKIRKNLKDEGHENTVPPNPYKFGKRPTAGTAVLPTQTSQRKKTQQPKPKERKKTETKKKTKSKKRSRTTTRRRKLFLKVSFFISFVYSDKKILTKFYFHQLEEESGLGDKDIEEDEPEED